ncbi:MAG: hypothetical protein Q9218_006833 [Villophora microphyllina]
MPAAPPPTPVQPSPFTSGLTRGAEQASSMDIDHVSYDLDSSSTTPTADVLQPQNKGTWQALTIQALTNVNTGWKAAETQAEHRQLLHDRTKEARRLYEEVRKSKAQTRKTKASEQKPAKRAAAHNSHVRVRTRKNKKMGMTSAGRIEKLNARKTAAVAKAKETARTKALERALGGLDLNAAAKDEQQWSSKQSLMCLPYALTLIPRAERAEKAFKHLQIYYHDPVKASILISGNEAYNLRILVKGEEDLQSLAREQGSVEAALVYQDEKVAEAEELAILRREFAKAEQAEHASGQDQSIAKAPREPLSMREDKSYTSVFSPKWVQEQYTSKGHKMDEQTALDLTAYHQDPSTKDRLSRQRKSALEEALMVGRTDIDLMRLENRQARLVQAYNASGEEGNIAKGNQTKRILNMEERHQQR